MKIQNEKMRVSLLALAVQGALLAMCAIPAQAEDDEVTALTMPTNYVEIGASNTSRNSAKFGEYNGLNKSGAKAVGNINVRGGDAYGESNGTKRWSVSGSDLGTTSRTLGVTMSDQGKWNLGFGYDELRHNITDSYQTPYQGAMGGNTFVLPSGVVPTVAPGTRVLNAATLAAMHTVDIGTSRKNLSFNAGVNLTPEWSLAFDYNRLNQSGAKLMGFGTAGNGGGLGAGLLGITGEAVTILPNPTNYKTDTINLALNWANEKGYMTTSYFGSFFKDGYDRVTFQTFGVTTALGTNTAMETMSTPPSNKFQQLNLNGGYQLAAKTKLTGGLSYGRNTQNDTFAYDSYMMITPPVNNTLNGLVVNTHADLNLRDQTTKDLTLSAGVKYDKRDNLTASNLYNFNSIGGVNTPAATSHVTHYPNTPLSNKKTQLELAGDYRLDKSQNIRLAYNREDVKRWCNNYATGGTTAGVDAYYAGVNNYPAGTNCVVATGSKDNKLSATYRVKASDDVKLNLGYSYSDRKTTSDPNAIAAFAVSVNGNSDPGAANATLFRGINGGDFQGFYPYFNASRKQQMVKAGANWQASNKLSVGVIGKITDDKYGSTYGVQKGGSWSANLDATYNYSENGSLSSYLTRQHMQRDLTSMQRSPALAAATGIPSGATWSNKLKNDDTTIGLGVKHGGLMSSKLELAADLTYSLGRSGYSTQLNYNPATVAASATPTVFGVACSDPTVLSCGDLPAITNKMIQFKLVGNYQLDKSSRVALGYIYRNLKSTDFYYNGMQYGNTPTSVLPTNQQAPSYSVSLVSASYIYNF
jgi:MtrB/PioB family decaheme-associated outer membrane protein